MKFLQGGKYFIVFCIVVVPLLTWAQTYPDPEKYLPTLDEFYKAKKDLDDPSDLMKVLHPKKYVPPEIYKLMEFDVKEMERQTAEVNGFKAPDVVGKVAPEIKPGKYTWKDLEKFPGLKELFHPGMLKKIKQGGPPLIGNIPEFEIIPTMCGYMNLPQIEMTRKSTETSKLDNKGYLVEGSWEGGIPFPRPSGPQKANQIFYNFERRTSHFDFNVRSPFISTGFKKNLGVDSKLTGFADYMKLGGRCFFPPFGYFDERAKKYSEYKAMLSVIVGPRNMRGTNELVYFYDSPYKVDQTLVYVPSLRRVRKLSATDSQDQSPMGGDSTYDDTDLWASKLRPDFYPYEIKVEEHEYLAPFSASATSYIDSKDGYSLKNIKLQRRPVYVIEMKQLDSSYIYSKRVYVVDRETWFAYWGEYWDQKGRFYRTDWRESHFFPEFGVITTYGAPCITQDWIDLHSNLVMTAGLTALWNRDHFSLETMTRYGK